MSTRIGVGPSDLRTQLRQLRLPSGRICLVHSSMRQLARLPNGPAALAAALLAVLGPQATLVVPAFTPRNSTTSRQFRSRTAGLTPEQRAAEESRIEPFDLPTTSAHEMGALAEHVRRHPRARRSAHPQTSFCAIGPAATELTADHDLDCHLGERSPLGRLYTTDAVVLLLGVDFTVCSCFHLAEHRLPWPPPRRRYRAYGLADGRRIVHDFVAADTDDGDFGQIGEAMSARPGIVRRGQVAGSPACWFALRDAVDFAVEWMSRSRPGTPNDRDRKNV